MVINIENINMKDKLKIKWCKNNCCGINYCEWYLKNGTKCKCASSKELIKIVIDSEYKKLIKR